MNAGTPPIGRQRCSFSRFGQLLTPHRDGWLVAPVRQVDTTHLQMDVDPTQAPGEYYRTMFEMFALVFEADIT